MASPCFLADVPKSEVDKALTTDRVAAIWRYAKANYLDRGASFEETLSGISNDVGIPRDVVARAFTKPKALRSVTNEVFEKQEARRNAIRNAKQYVQTIDAPAALKLLNVLTSVPRRILTFGHGPVFPVTHALELGGSEPAAYFKAVGDSWRFAKKSSHAAAMDALRNEELYPMARRGGLVVDPEQGPQGILTGGSGGWARRAWDALKVTRMELFKDRFNTLPKAEQTLDNAKLISSQINHSTGAMSPGEFGIGALSKGMFAPQLTMSKIAKTFVDPTKTAITYGKVLAGEEVPFSERNIASLRTRQAAKAVGSLAGLLVINQGFNIASGSKDRVNFTDRSKGDWLRPKAFGHTLNMRGSEELIRLVGNLVAISQASHKELRGKSRTESVRDAVARYGQYKLDPSIQIAGEAALGEDTFGRPLPWSSEKGTPSRPKYTTTEYIMTKGPIWLGGATREVYDAFREEGLNATDATSLIRALGNHADILAKGAAVGAAEAVGGGIQKAREPKEKTGVGLYR